MTNHIDVSRSGWFSWSRINVFESVTAESFISWGVT